MNEICRRLGISEQTYKTLIYEAGEAYFDMKCRGWNQVRDAFRRSPQIWAWWRRQYEMMDEWLIYNAPAIDMEIYRKMHTDMDYYPSESLVKRAMDDYDKVVQEEIQRQRAAL